MSDPSTCPPSVRERIEADCREEEKNARLRSIFAKREEAKRPPFKRFAGPIACDNGVFAVREMPDEPGEASDGFDWYHAAQGDYQAVCANQTGQTVPDEVFETGRSRRWEQDKTSVELAKALDSTGRFAASPYYKGENNPNRCTVIGVFSGEALPLPSVKRSNILPSIAKANRAKMLRDIEHFMATLPGSGRKASMFTITNGPRVGIHPVTLREATGNFHRWLSKMAATQAFKAWGLRMEWRATEFGTPKWQHDPSSGMDQMTMHLHAHCLVTMPERMSPRRRKKMRKKLWRVFGVVWDDAGDIVNAREFVKYPVKDSDLKTILTQAGPGVLADFCEAVRGMHIVQPMGELKRVRCQRRSLARRITAFTRLDGRTLEETGDWNAGKRPLTGPNKNRKEYRKRALAAAAKMSHSVSVDQTGVQTPDDGGETPVETGDGGDRSSDPDRNAGEKTPPPKNRVIALLAPAPYGSAICEPGVVVWGFDGNTEAVLKQPRVAAIIERHRRDFEDAEAARALIRACATRAGAHALAASESSQRSNNCPRAERPRPPDLAELALADSENWGN